ncbi:MAG: hypothetical protein H6825_03375 [Planctomycetes bacterium]|nr:hypothetical protein [Planctomycetota bacterium]
MANDEQLQRGHDGAPSAPLVATIRRVLGKDAARLPDPFDLGDPTHVDAAARPLLRRFYERADAACFSPLVELTCEFLAPVALDVVREVGLPLSDDSMLGAFYGALFCDTRPAQVDVRDFLSFAERKLRVLAEARVKWFAARPIPHLERLPSGLPAPRSAYPGAPDEGDPIEEPQSIDKLVPSGAPPIAAAIDFEHLGFTFTWLVETLYYRLDQAQRVVLRAAEIEGKSPRQIAERSEVDVSEATARLDSARAALAHSIEDVCERLAGKARRAGCTLSGKRPDEITAEDVAKHLVECDACVKSLDAVSAQREALVVLGSPRDPKTSRVAALVADAHGKGKEALANFLYELARACTDQSPSFHRRAEQILRPEPPHQILEDVDQLRSRSAESVEAIDPASQEQWVALTRTVVAALERVEGETARVLLRKAYCEVLDSDWDTAQELLTKAVDVAEGPFKDTCRHALLTALSESGRHQDAIDLARVMLSHGTSAKAAWYGIWRSLALLGRVDECAHAAIQFRATDAIPSAREAWATQIREAAEELSAILRCKPSDIHEALGLAELEAGS